MERNIRISSVLVNFLKICLKSAKKRKAFILFFLVALPIVIVIWFGLLVSLAACLTIFFAGSYLFISPIIEASRLDYDTLLLFLVGLFGVSMGIPYFKALRNSFKSGEILLEQLLPVAGASLWLLGLMGIAIWLAIL